MFSRLRAEPLIVHSTRFQLWNRNAVVTALAGQDVQRVPTRAIVGERSKVIAGRQINNSLAKNVCEILDYLPAHGSISEERSSTIIEPVSQLSKNPHYAH